MIDLLLPAGFRTLLPPSGPNRSTLLIGPSYQAKVLGWVNILVGKSLVAPDKLPFQFN